MIQVRDLAKRFRVPERRPGFWGGVRTLFSRTYREVTAVDRVSFTVGRGEIVGYLGPNGAGKSTTIKMLTGILHPSSGEVLVDGASPHRERARNSRSIGAVFGQRSQLLWDLPPRDTFDLLRRMYAIPRARYRDTLAEFTELLGLGELLDRPVRLLSLGQRMRCELAAALLHDPPLVYLDEPTIGLDVVAKERIRDFILRLNRERGTTVLLTTHDLADIETLCRRVIIIDRGTVIYDGALADLRRRFGRRRRVVFSLADGARPDDAAAALASPEVQAVVREDRAVAVSFDPRVVAASELTRRIVNRFPVADLAVEEADLEQIIKAIYQPEAADA
jgi:ABC-2 type transport system ATP-binding protein